MRDRSIKLLRAAHLRGARQVPAGTGLFIVAVVSVSMWCAIAIVARML